MRKSINCDQGWLFHLGDILSVRNRWAWGKSGSWNQGPEGKSYDDRDWRKVDLPHDFVFETRPYDYSDREFDRDNAIPAMEDVNNIHTTAGSFDRQAGWYRRHFFLPKEYEGKKLYLVFEGVYRNSSVFLNEFYIGGERSGYTRMALDISDTAAYGEENVLALRCDASEAEGWFYEGGGIYRHVTLLVTEPEHLEDIFIRGEPDLDTGEAELFVEIGTTVEDTAESDEDNEGDAGRAESGEGDSECGCEIHAVVTDAEGREVLALRGRAAARVSLRGSFTQARLWSPRQPYLYRLRLQLWRFGILLDEKEQDFGIRAAVFDSERGFWLNGIPIKIKGVCCHQNHGGLGTAVPDEVFRYRIRRLKEMGANAYRCSHYPPSEGLLQICDQEGMLVMDEVRLLSSEEGDLRTLRQMVRMGRSHPCVVLYSIGNEEAQSQATPQGARIAATMLREVRRLDPYTPVTMALLMWDLKNRKPYTDTEVLAGISEQLDVAGFNYHEERWEDFHRRYPDQPFICTEQGTFKSTRGCYETDAARCHLAVTDRTADSYMRGAAQWRACLPDWVSGLFLWTGFDYYGEPTPFAWPAISSQFGVMDLCGYPKDFYWYYKAWWTEEPVLHVFPGGNAAPGTMTDYYVFSNFPEVELFRDGVSQGRKTMESHGYLVWEGVSAPGEELAVAGYRDGVEERRGIYRPAGKETHLEFTQDYKENEVVIYRAAVVDERGQVVPDRDREFEIPEEWGTLLGASNGDPSDHTPGKSRVRRTFHGLAQVIVKFVQTEQ